MQLQTIVTLTYYYYITSYFYILLLRSRLLSENSAPIFEFSSFIHTYFLHCCSSYYYPTPHVLLLYLHIVVLQKKTPIQSQKTCFLICLLVYITTASKKAIHGLVQIMHYILEAMQCRQQNVDMISALNF